MTQALERHDTGEVRVIPILIRPVSWEEAPFSKLQILPREGIPITSKQWESRDDAWLNVVKELRSVIANLKKTRQPQVTAPSPRIWHIPHRRNPFFTGREGLLKQLRDRLTTHGTTALTQPQAISGLGGIGKTQTALEYAYRYQHDYRTVLWVNAAAPETLLTDFAKLAQVVGLPLPEAQDPQQAIAQVKIWLAQHQDWLLILDNADDLENASSYFSENNTTNRHIILTTRAQAAGSLAATLEVEEMAQTEGALLLLRRAGILSQGATLDQATAKAQTDAGAIVQLLDGLPLAIDQAGAYIEETGCSFAGYLELYKQRRNELLAHRGRFPPGHSEPVATTWDLSFRLIEQANPAAADLLRLCAFLNPDAIPESLITEGASELGPALSALAEDTYALNQAIAEVRKFSLLRRKTETQTLSMHRLVQAVLKDQMDEQTQRLWAERAIKAMYKVTPVKDITKWREWQPYLVQIQTCAILSTHYQVENTEAADLFDEAAEMLRMYAYFDQAEPLYQRALAINEKVLGTEHPSTSKTLNNLALLYSNQGKYGQAELLCQRALAINEKTLGPEHPHTATTLNSLANLYHNQGKYELVEPLYQRALTIDEKILGPEHPYTAITLHNLAFHYSAQGKYEQAEPLYQRALTIDEKILGPENPYTATTLHNLANLYHAQGKYEQAEPLYQRALVIREKVLAPEHNSIAVTLFYLANLYSAQGKYEQAEPLYQRAITIDEQAYGVDHPEVATDLEGYAMLLLEMGRNEEAATIKARAEAIRAKQAS